MAKDPAFLFYPGDYLRDTQCLSEKSQVAYDRIMCEHMRNICISKERLNFFTKRLSPDELDEIMSVVVPVDGGFQIEWVALSVSKRRDYSQSRRENRQKKEGTHDNDMINTSTSYVEHMENEIANKNEIKVEKKKGGAGGKTKTTAQIAFDLIPDTFHGDEFAVLWDDYEKLRKKKNKPLTETAVKQRVGQLVTISGGEWGIAKASMEETISSGWDRFFEVKQNGSSNQSSQVNGKRVRDKF